MSKKFISTVSLLLFILLSACTDNAATTKATFVRAVDGDTLIVNINGEEQYIRLLLVDTPETKHPDKEVQKYGPEASDFMKQTFSASDSIKIEYGTEKRDKYNRLLAYVYTEDNKMINKLLLENGLARVAYVYPPNDKYVDEFHDIEQQAKEQHIGIWSINGYVTEKGFNMSAVNSTKTEKVTIDFPFEPNGKDRDCSDFSSQDEAQAFFEAAGGPEKDPHRLDGEGDNFVCEGI
ncbi:thermonuclease family protein [Virgibacillus ndiopensis]|uniref:thermonuclease family protein n=1 Tax=Virgibacillus ndiopensis TaxID=2004408 RepID=UPI00159BBE9D|nr:thermonuclease family protein [Virgibacillus ndiopensis]